MALFSHAVGYERLICIPRCTPPCTSPGLPASGYPPPAPEALSTRVVPRRFMRNLAGVSWNLHLLSSPFGRKSKTFLGRQMTESFIDAIVCLFSGLFYVRRAVFTANGKNTEVIVHGGHHWEMDPCSLSCDTPGFPSAAPDTPPSVNQPTLGLGYWDTRPVVGSGMQTSAMRLWTLLA